MEKFPPATKFSFGGGEGGLKASRRLGPRGRWLQMGEREKEEDDPDRKKTREKKKGTSSPKEGKKLAAKQEKRSSLSEMIVKRLEKDALINVGRVRFMFPSPKRKQSKRSVHRKNGIRWGQGKGNISVGRTESKNNVYTEIQRLDLEVKREKGEGVLTPKAKHAIRG